MTVRARVFVGLLAVTLGVFAVAAPLVNVPLRWKPTSDLRLAATQMTAAAVQFEPFKDIREMPDKVGENREDDKPKPVTTSDDVGAFVSTHMRDLFSQAGVKTVDTGGDVVVKGEVRQFFVRETHTYKAEVSIHLTVVGRDGTTLYSGVTSGEASRFGRSYVLENYYEVLSDAVVNATSSALQNVEFQKALSQH
ncbi:MAG: hypothetical protein JWL65_5898 [Gammaproteobacteria bacterium]|nr:hypothetical protein [Gammaproteobacteria bacterium]